MIQHPGAVSELVYQSAADNVKHTQGMVTSLLEQLHDIDPDDTYVVGLDDVTARADESIEKLLEVRDAGTVQGPPTPPPQQQLQGTHNLAGQNKVHANDSLKLFTLSIENAPEEFRDWRKQFDTYYSTSQLDSLIYKDQVGYLRVCIDKDLFCHVERHLEQATFIMDGGGAMTILEEEFRLQYPLFSRHHKYFSVQLPQGMSESKWLQELI